MNKRRKLQKLRTLKRVKKNKKFTLKYLAALTNSKFSGDENAIISGINSLEFAKETEISFLANDKYLEAMKKSLAAAICIGPLINISKFKKKNFLISENPSKTFQKITELFLNKEISGFKNIHPSCQIHKSAIIEKDVLILPLVVIDKNVSIQSKSTIYSHTYIGANVKIGKNVTIYSNVTIRENVIIKDNVIIQPGAVIGACGFGYIQDKDGNFMKLEQMGSVIIEQDVEIGANTVIDRARFQNTIIKKNSKIDNLVQIAHNVEIGENNAIAAQSGFSGSSKTGKNVIIAGQVGIAGHLKISENTKIAAKAGVSKNLKTGNYRGSPAIDINKWNKRYVLLKNIEKFLKKLNDLEKKISSFLK